MIARVSRYGRTASLIVAFVLPLLLAYIWGANFVDQAYLPLRFAQNFSDGLGLTYNAAENSSSPLLQSPMFALILIIGGWLGFPIHNVALVISALGWSALAQVISRVTQSWQTQTGGILAGLLGKPQIVIGKTNGEFSAVSSRKRRRTKLHFVQIFSVVYLIILSPGFFQSLGTEISWMLTWGWLALFFINDNSSKNGQDSKSTKWSWLLLLLAILLTNFSLETIGLVSLLIGIRAIRRKRMPWLDIGLVIVVTLAWIGMAQSSQSSIDSFFELDPMALPTLVGRLWYESELYSLTLPLIILGLIGIRRSAGGGFLAVAMGWFILAGLTGNEVVVVVLALFFTGMGAADLGAWLITGAETRASNGRLQVVIPLLLGSVLLAAQIESLVRQYRERPYTEWQNQELAADWIRSDAQEGASLLATERVAYATGLPAISTDNSLALTDADYQAYVLDQQPPDYLVFSDSQDWLRITHRPWFREQYAPLHSFPSATTSEPYTIWGYRESTFNLGQRQLAQVISPAGVEIVGYQFEGEVAEPGGNVEATIHLRSEWPLFEPFITIIRLDALADGVTMTEHRQLTPASVSPAAWQNGDIISERLSFTLPETLEYGAYRVNVSFQGMADSSMWPLYQDNDENVLDRASLGYMVVPWTEPTENATEVNALFGERIILTGFTLSGEWRQNGAAKLILYWQTAALPLREYFLFIHLFDENDNLIFNSNERPTYGEFPMRAWYPGAAIRDEQLLSLPPDLSPGRYRLFVGFFDFDTNERLSLRASDGNELDTRTLYLSEIIVR